MFILKYSEYKIKIAHKRPLLEDTFNVIKS